MPELRLNLIAREWVIVVSERPKSPEQYKWLGERRYVPSHDPHCPFCPGNEEKTPSEIMRLADDGGWKIRVAPNKYAALSPGGERQRMSQGYKRMVTAVGRQEVIIEHPRHDFSPALMEEGELEAVLSVYKERFVAAYEDRRIQHVIIFKNHGVSSGTTIRHPHTQLIGVPVMPHQVHRRIEEAIQFFDDTGECIQCGILKDEMADKKRLIVETEHFASFIPYAALSPFHMWIFPKRHMPSYSGCTEEEIRDFARILKATLSKLYHGLDDPDFNYVLRSVSPFRMRTEYLHWYLSIVPQVMNVSGIELGSGMHINHSLPEDVAAFLRDVKV